MKLTKRINIENKDIWGLTKVKERMSITFLGERLTFYFLGDFLGDVVKKREIREV